MLTSTFLTQGDMDSQNSATKTIAMVTSGVQI